MIKYDEPSVKHQDLALHRHLAGNVYPLFLCIVILLSLVPPIVIPLSLAVHELLSRQLLTSGMKAIDHSEAAAHLYKVLAEKE